MARNNYSKDTYCPECGQYFNYLGFARHRAKHSDDRSNTVTTEQIIGLGWEHYATASNGGSKQFKIGNLFSIESNIDNFILKRDRNYKRYEIVLRKVVAKDIIEIHREYYVSEKRLIKLMKKYGIQINQPL